jgi:FMN phosphatase YigB (HAD superfamily)
MAVYPDNAQDLIFLFDIDNTLLDSDGFVHDLTVYLKRELGIELAARYWQLYSDLRAQGGFADYLGAVQALRLEHINDMRLLKIALFLFDYPFAQRVFPGVPAVLEHCRRWGETVILSDGDAVFQPLKIQRAGLAAAVENRVLIYIHKELMLEPLQELYPARHYVLVDDKPSILTAMKNLLGERLTTVFPRQGHYALDPRNNYPAADVTLDHIADLQRYDKSALLRAAGEPDGKISPLNR